MEDGLSNYIQDINDCDLVAEHCMVSLSDKRTCCTVRLSLTFPYWIFPLSVVNIFKQILLSYVEDRKVAR